MNNKLIDIKRTVPKHYNPIKIVRSVYCEVAFLLQIQHLLELPKAPLDRTVLDSQLDMIVHLLVDFDLYLDIPDNVATQLSSNSNVSEFTGIRCLLHKIAQKRAGLTRSVPLCGQSHFVPITQINEHLTSQSLNAIYLTSLDAETCKQVENDYGIVAIRYDEKQEKFNHSNFFQLSLLNTQVKKGIWLMIGSS